MLTNTTKADFNLDRHLILLMQDNPFFAEISRNIRKQQTTKLPTAGVTFDPVNDELLMFWNPDFFDTLTTKEIRGVLVHEFYHIVFGHINARRKNPHKLWNIATDLAINSIIMQNAGIKPGDESDNWPLPRFCFIPGHKLVFKPKIGKDGKEILPTEEERKIAEHHSKLIESFPPMMASEWYYNKLIEDQQQNPDMYKGNGECDGSCQPGDPGEGDGECKGGHGYGSLDDHSVWDNVSDEQREYVEGKVKALVEKAVKEADQRSNGWGSIPAEIQSAIRKSISTVVNWRAVLKQFVGTLNRGERSTSIKRINRRYPYIHPGVKRGYTAKLLVAIDQSGSVDDGQLAQFFAELTTLTRRVSVDILPFDCEANIKDLFAWPRGTTPKVQRVRGGGTDFDAPTNLVNDPRNRGRWDGYLIMTDGIAPAPVSSRIKRGWVLSTGNKLQFDSSELQVFVDENKPMTGAWR